MIQHYFLFTSRCISFTLTSTTKAPAMMHISPRYAANIPASLDENGVYDGRSLSGLKEGADADALVSDLI